MNTVSARERLIVSVGLGALLLLGACKAVCKDGSDPSLVEGSCQCKDGEKMAAKECPSGDSAAMPVCPTRQGVKQISDPGTQASESYEIGDLSSVALCNAVGNGDTDTFSFSLPEDAEVSITMTDLEQAVGLRFGEDANSNGILETSEEAYSYPFGSQSMTWRFPKGRTFFVEVKSSNSTSLSYVLNLTATTLYDSSGDDPGSSPAEAIALADRATGYVGGFDKEDYWSFTVSKRSTVTVTIEDVVGEAATCGFHVVRDTNSNGVVDSGEETGLWGGLQGKTASKILDAGDYYLRMTGAGVDARKGCLYSLVIGYTAATGQ